MFVGGWCFRMFQESLPHSVDVRYLGKFVGVFTSDRIFVTHRRQEHVFRKFNGLGLSYGLIRQLMDANCSLIRLILDNGDGSESVYNVSPVKFLTDGIPWIDKQSDTQRILPFCKMDSKVGLENYW